MLDWYSPSPDREPNILLWMGLSVWAAEVVGATWRRWAAVVAAEATGAAYVLLVVGVQALTARAGGAGVWRPDLKLLAFAVGIIAVAAHYQAGRAHRRVRAAGQNSVVETESEEAAG